MIEQNVQVVACHGDYIQVRLGSQTGCSACDNGKGCGAGVFAKLLARKPVVLQLERNELRVVNGQMVTLSFPERVYLRLVFASYGWPLLAAMGGSFAGYGLGVWLQLGPGQVDVLTLFCALLFAGMVVRYVKAHGDKGSVLSTYCKVDYCPSDTPDMCGSTMKESRES